MTTKSATGHKITCQLYCLGLSETPSCCTQPLKLEIMPFPPGLPGFPCQIFIEAETLDGHHQTYSALHKEQSNLKTTTDAKVQ